MTQRNFNITTEATLPMDSSFERWLAAAGFITISRMRQKWSGNTIINAHYPHKHWVCEWRGQLPQGLEIEEYYIYGAGKHDPIEQVTKDLIEWFDGSPYIAGRGGSHVWVSEQGSDDRRLMMYQQ